MTSTVCSSYFKDHQQDLLFLNADLYEEQQAAMHETNPEDWIGYEHVELLREDPLIGRINEF
tara:strand:- start:374 stop:559 length:186 start_codon:yes stop_codon:yes gene_type:complete